MLRTLSPRTRAALAVASAEARSTGAAEITAEHLVAALLDDPELASRLRLDRTVRQRVLGELEQARRRGGLGSSDARALAELGIDLDALVDRVEQSLGRARWPTGRAGVVACA